MQTQYLEVHIRKEQVEQTISFNNNYIEIILMKKLVQLVFILLQINIIQYFLKITVNVKK